VARFSAKDAFRIIWRLFQVTKRPPDAFTCIRRPPYCWRGAGYAAVTLVFWDLATRLRVITTADIDVIERAEVDKRTAEALIDRVR
jgi:hypothetical protein